MRNNFIDDGIFEFEVFIFFVRCKFNLNIFILIFIIRLVNKFILNLSVFSKGFMV